MRGSLSSIVVRAVCTVVLAGGLVVWGGCDTASAPGTLQNPSVSGLRVVLDSVVVQDSTARVGVVIDSVQATDPDGSIVRTSFVLEPSSNPRATLTGNLPPQNPPVYGDTLALALPLIDEIYTVRVFAVDDDSLASNQVTGQFRFGPADSSSASEAFTLSK